MDKFPFFVPIEYLKQKFQVQVELDALIVSYHQHDQNSCCFRSSDSAFKWSKKLVAANAIGIFILTLLTDAITNRKTFTILITSNHERKFGYQHRCYKMEQ